jgi:hypothetical protein
MGYIEFLPPRRRSASSLWLWVGTVTYILQHSWRKIFEDLFNSISYAPTIRAELGGHAIISNILDRVGGAVHRDTSISLGVIPRGISCPLLRTRPLINGDISCNRMAECELVASARCSQKALIDDPLSSLIILVLS